MICFLDRSFCSSSDQCGNKTCPRNLTPALVQRGEQWWGGSDFPVAVADYKDGCPDFKEIGGFDNEEEDSQSSEA